MEDLARQLETGPLLRVFATGEILDGWLERFMHRAGCEMEIPLEITKDPLHNAVLIVHADHPLEPREEQRLIESARVRYHRVYQRVPDCPCGHGDGNDQPHTAEQETQA